jgi:hypothetical protein
MPGARASRYVSLVQWFPEDVSGGLVRSTAIAGAEEQPLSKPPGQDAPPSDQVITAMLGLRLRQPAVTKRK